MEATLEAANATTRGKNEARRTRARRPGAGGASTARDEGSRRDRRSPSIRRRCSRILHSESGANTLIALKLAGAGDTRVLVKEYQLDPITHQLLHADFYRVAMDKRAPGHDPGHVKGEPKGVKQQGGIARVRHAARSRSSACRPTSRSTSTSTSPS